jgi:hypothetical protein
VREGRGMILRFTGVAIVSISAPPIRAAARCSAGVVSKVMLPAPSATMRTARWPTALPAKAGINSGMAMD